MIVEVWIRDGSCHSVASIDLRRVSYIQHGYAPSQYDYRPESIVHMDGGAVLCVSEDPKDFAAKVALAIAGNEALK